MQVLSARVDLDVELRKTAADVWIRPPRELVRFLQRWRNAGRRPR